MTAAQRAHYDECLANGCTPGLAEMFALQVAPMSWSEREFLEGHCNGKQFEDVPHVGELYRKEAVKAGVNPTGKIYHGGIAEYPGDPKAWIDGRSHLKSICEANGWGCRGAVNTKLRNDVEPTKVDVAEHIVEQYARKAVAADPALARKPVEEVKAAVKEKLKPKKRTICRA